MSSSRARLCIVEAGRLSRRVMELRVVGMAGIVIVMVSGDTTVL